jgi:hypothetical protein
MFVKAAGTAGGGGRSLSFSVSWYISRAVRVAQRQELAYHFGRISVGDCCGNDQIILVARTRARAARVARPKCNGVRKPAPSQRPWTPAPR